MSSLIAYINRNEFVIATDTFVHEKKDNNLIPVNFCSKTIYFPHLKCCVAGQGIASILNQLFVFVQERVIATDVYSLVKQTTQNFEVIRDQGNDNENLATLFFFGVNDTTNVLEVYKITVLKSKTNEYEQIPFGLICKPEILNIDKILESTQNLNIDQVFVQLMKEQRRQDDSIKNHLRVGIGGQIQITTLIFDDETNDLIIQIKMLNAFDDFDGTYHRMLGGT